MFFKKKFIHYNQIKSYVSPEWLLLPLLKKTKKNKKLLSRDLNDIYPHCGFPTQCRAVCGDSMTSKLCKGVCVKYYTIWIKTI